MKVGYVYCYKQLNYVRSTSLLAMLARDNGLKVVSARNTTKTTGRYIQTLWRLMIMRICHRPDVYILAFRGFEIYWPVRLLTLGKPLIFDEFINLHDWMVHEHKKFNDKGLFARAIKVYMWGAIQTSQSVLTDTNLHAQSSSLTYSTPIQKYRAIYVGTDEELFYPRKKSTKPNKEFIVFFYGNFLPLHGLDIILQAAVQVQGLPIRFQLIGGANRESSMNMFKERVKALQLKNIEHKPWVEYAELPKWIAQADLCLGGPFGNTPQSQKVITGKTFQFLAMKKTTVIGRINEQVGFADKENCILIQQGDPKALAEAIIWAYNNQEQTEDQAQKGHDLYLSNFSIKAQSKSLVETIRSTVSE